MQQSCHLRAPPDPRPAPPLLTSAPMARPGCFFSHSCYFYPFPESRCAEVPVQLTEWGFGLLLGLSISTSH